MSTFSFDTLYHPSYVPPVSWVKVQLLLWDRIFRIVPLDMQDEFGDEYIERVFGINPNIMPMLSPEPSDLRYYDEHKASLELAFQDIRRKAQGGLKDPELLGIHPAKAPRWLFAMLEDMGLAKEVEQEYAYRDEKHHWIQEDAGHLVMSCLGSRMASRRGLEPITDRKMSFYLTAANEVSEDFSDRQDSSMEEALAVAVFRFFVPRRIESLSFQQILELREEYTELRRAFHGTIRRVSQDHNLEGIVQQERAQEALTECLQEFIEKEKKFKKEKVKRFLEDWRVQSVGVALGGIGAAIAGGPAAGLGFTMAEAAVALANALFVKRNSSDFEQSFHYLQILNENIRAGECASGIRRYLPRIVLPDGS